MIIIIEMKSEFSLYLNLNSLALSWEPGSVHCRKNILRLRLPSVQTPFNGNGRKPRACSSEAASRKRVSSKPISRLEYRHESSSVAIWRRGDPTGIPVSGEAGKASHIWKTKNNIRCTPREIDQPWNLKSRGSVEILNRGVVRACAKSPL